MHWLGEVDHNLQDRCVRHILKRQLRDGGWNIYYSGPSEINASRKSILRFETRGSLPRCAVHARSARQHHAPRRYSAHEHLQQTLPRVARSISLAISADDSGGNDSAAAMVAVSHLQDVVLEPGDAHSARDHQSFQADARTAGHETTARALSARHRAQGFPFAAERALLDLAQFISAGR